MVADDAPTAAFGDFAALVALTAATLVVVFLAEYVPFSSVVRLAVGLPFLLFAPGYAVVAVLYPRSRPSGTWSGPRKSARPDEAAADPAHPGGLTPVERFVLSVMASLVVVALVALAADGTPWGIRAGPVATGVGAVTLVALAVAAWRRLSVPPESRPGDTGDVAGAVGSLAGTVRNSSRGTTVLNVAVAASVVVALAVVAVPPFGPPASEQFSEYQLLTEGEDGAPVATDYPTELVAGEEASLLVRIENHEGRQVEYMVVVQLQEVNGTDGSPTVTERTELNRFQVSVGAGESRTVEHSPAPTATGEVRLVYLFYKDAVPDDPTRETADGALHLWTNVSDSGDE